MIVTTTTQMHAGAATLQLKWKQAQLLAAALCEHQNAYSFTENGTERLCNRLIPEDIHARVT